jgi:SAM-dependent methyltransferase
LPPERLRYLRHDLRTPLPETGFDVACNIFSSFGYGTEEEDVAIFRTLRDAVRPGGRVLVETNHRDLTCTVIARGSKASKRLADGTLFLDEPDFDPISGVVRLNWYWSGLAPSKIFLEPFGNARVESKATNWIDSIPSFGERADDSRPRERSTLRAKV